MTDQRDGDVSCGWLPTRSGLLVCRPDCGSDQADEVSVEFEAWHLDKGGWTSIYVGASIPWGPPIVEPRIDWLDGAATIELGGDVYILTCCRVAQIGVSAALLGPSGSLTLGTHPDSRLLCIVAPLRAGATIEIRDSFGQPLGTWLIPA